MLDAAGLPLGVVTAIAGQSSAARRVRGPRRATPGRRRWTCAATRWPPRPSSCSRPSARRATSPGWSPRWAAIARAARRDERDPGPGGGDARRPPRRGRRARGARSALRMRARRRAARRRRRVARSTTTPRRRARWCRSLRRAVADRGRAGARAGQRRRPRRGDDGRVTDAAMLFVRCAGGISHHPDEVGERGGRRRWPSSATRVRAAGACTTSSSAAARSCRPTASRPTSGSPTGRSPRSPRAARAGREELDARGLHVLPGGIDAHVHFNEPGRTHWEGWATGTAALAAGGMTACFEMPLNAHPPTVDAHAFDAKLAAARRPPRGRLRPLGRDRAGQPRPAGGAARARRDRLQGVHVAPAASTTSARADDARSTRRWRGGAARRDRRRARRERRADRAAGPARTARD